MTSHEPLAEPNAYEKVGEYVGIFLRGKVWYVNYQHGARQLRRSLKVSSKKEARRKALIIEKELLAGDHRSPRRAPLLAELVTEYLTNLQSEGRSASTMSKYRFCFQMLLDLAERCRIQRVDQIDLRFIDRFRAERTAGSGTRQPARPKTVHTDIVIVRQLVNFAMKRQLLIEDPLQGLQVAKPKRTPQPCWTRGQVDQILAAAGPAYRSVLLFLAETGTRVGEAKWLTWTDIDLERRLVYIRPKEGWTPKSRDQRVIPISDALRKMLISLPRTANWVFPARSVSGHLQAGRQFSERRLLEYLKRLLKRLGLKGHLHTFRHSFISFAAQHGVSERVLRAWVGHVDREVLDWYFHLADDQSVAAMRRLTEAAHRTQADATDASAQNQHNS